MHSYTMTKKDRNSELGKHKNKMGTESPVKYSKQTWCIVEVLTTDVQSFKHIVMNV